VGRAAAAWIDAAAHRNTQQAWRATTRRHCLVFAAWLAAPDEEGAAAALDARLQADVRGEWAPLAPRAFAALRACGAGVSALSLQT
jgi:hypothetical protein